MPSSSPTLTPSTSRRPKSHSKCSAADTPTATLDGSVGAVARRSGEPEGGSRAPGLPDNRPCAEDATAESPDEQASKPRPTSSAGMPPCTPTVQRPARAAGATAAVAGLPVPAKPRVGPVPSALGSNSRRGASSAISGGSTDSTSTAPRRSNGANKPAATARAASGAWASARASARRQDARRRIMEAPARMNDHETRGVDDVLARPPSSCGGSCNSSSGSATAMRAAHPPPPPTASRRRPRPASLGTRKHAGGREGGAGTIADAGTCTTRSAALDPRHRTRVETGTEGGTSTAANPANALMRTTRPGRVPARPANGRSTRSPTAGRGTRPPSTDTASQASDHCSAHPARTLPEPNDAAAAPT